jgi:pimeloyl-ACP methyl ester carboxylesterase
MRRAARPAPIDVTSPSLLLLALELRAFWEAGLCLPALPLLRTAPRGDGHPVLVFPGLAANDMSTLPLRLYLMDRGFAPHPWRIGFNTGPKKGVLERCAERIRALADDHGGKVSLVGWSLGGIYARELAKQLPDRVRSVITLGTPFTGNLRASNARWVFERLSGQAVPDAAAVRSLREPPPVPCTSIYSKTDGVVAWQCSVQGESALTENIEVPASHLGLGVNPLALYALADRLAQPEGAWRPLDRSGVRGLLFG